MSNRLTVWWDGRVAGTLYLDPFGETQFAYDPAWLAAPRAPALSFSLPKQAEPFHRRVCQSPSSEVFCLRKASTAIAFALSASLRTTTRLLEHQIWR